MEAERETLRTELLHWMRGGSLEFEPTALRLFAYQFTHNLPFQAYCKALGTTPGEVIRWQDIPPVPAEAFKSGLPLRCFPATATIRTFLTSGTTGESQGRHEFRDLSLYETSLRGTWRHFALPDCGAAFFLCRPPVESPDSSLTHMFGTLSPDDDPGRWLATTDQQLDLGPLLGECQRGRPVVLFGTSLALLHCCNSTPPTPLPAGSHIFHTGGFKGLAETHHAAGVAAAILDHFKLPADNLINEYGMTELSSQCYAIGSSPAHQAPPWLRVVVIDPATGRPVSPGGTGYLVLYDLANLDSVLAVRTRDFARFIDHSRFELLGRDPAALPRGCSRASAAFFQSAP